jgi:hypothetical protein
MHVCKHNQPHLDLVGRSMPGQIATASITQQILRFITYVSDVTGGAPCVDVTLDDRYLFP